MLPKYFHWLQGNFPSSIPELSKGADVLRLHAIAADEVSSREGFLLS